MDRNLLANFVHIHALAVALRKESVDRNFNSRVTLPPHQRRSPQGERG